MASDLEIDCFDFTERLLRDYVQLCSSLNELEKDRNLLRAEIPERAITYEGEKVSPTNKISNEVENAVMRAIEQINSIQREINSINSLKRKIDNAINNLRPIHKDIIEMKFKQDLDWQEIIDKTNYSERSLIYKKNEAVRSIAIVLFNTKVFKQEAPTLFDMIDL